ncbi:LacI family DNA-binding transcriptional regulator [Parafilimonas sp.]|uniref:LacI family DNA-binding transcriptional regulator n=1 Tax=Parafilimonas sp. TaxID=1969739 RepID=UPI0039E51CF2
MGPLHDITIKDIAQRLNVSVSTVSRALRGSTDIKKETRELILQVASDLNYMPNPIALSLKDKKTKVIGVMVQEIANNYCSATIAGIEEYANKMGYQVLISQSHEKYDLEVINTHLLASRRIDGMIITISNETKNTAHLQELIDKGIPVVMFDRVCARLPSHKVVVDDYEGSYNATQHLIQQGYEHIAHLTISPGLAITQNRLKGYKDALKTYGLITRKEWIIHCDFNLAGMENSVRKLLLSPNRPRAILSSVERLSMVCLKIMKQLDLKVPDDVAIAGFSDNPVSSFLSPTLTAVTQPTFEIGQHAAALLINQIETKETPKEYTTIQLKTTLDIRESSLAGKKPVNALQA